jgi:hypothetical protein
MLYLKYSNVASMLYLNEKHSLFIRKKPTQNESAFVKAGRLVLPHIAALDPKSNVSTNFTMPSF